MTRILDELGRAHSSLRRPQRIVSLVPSDTFSLVTLGARSLLVGRTEYCVEPADLGDVPIIGGTKNADIEKIVSQKPDLVLANKEENSRGDVETLVAAGIDVFVSFPKRVADGVAHLARLALLLGVGDSPVAKDVVRRAYQALREAEAARANMTPLRAFVPIWMEPLMTIHGDTFISDMMDLAGAYNVFSDRPRRYPLAADLGKAKPLSAEKTKDRDTRYPRVTLDEVILRAPEIVLLPDEPHPFSEADADVFRALPLPASKSGTVVRCVGKDLCWPGAQSIEGLARARELVASMRLRIEHGGAS